MMPLHTIRCLLLIVLTTTISVARADEARHIADLQIAAQEQHLWQSTEWINLLHYNGKGKLADNYESEVNDSRFFIAPDGRTNPESELNATLAAFYKTDVTGDEHAQCEFIARLNWLKQKLSIDSGSLPVVHCDKYIEWRKLVRSDSVTLIFPAYNLNSPSSMFGHTLLRLDSAEDKGNSRWLSTAINFGADVREGDNSILYAVKGLVGGYSGTFVTDHYYKKITVY